MKLFFIAYYFMEGDKRINFMSIIDKMKKFDINYELEDKLGELNSVSFPKARRRRESAAIFNRLNEDTCINLLNDPLELSRAFEEEDVFEFHLSKELTTPEKKVIDYMDIDTPTPRMDSSSTTTLAFSQNMNASQKVLSIPSENTREAAKNTYFSLKMDSESAQAMNDTMINYDTSETKQNNITLKQSNQDLMSIDNTNDESLLIEQRARTTLNQFKEIMSKFKTLNVEMQPPPSKSATKSELKANLSNIKCPDDVVRLVNHLLYSPIGIHRTHSAQEMKIQGQHNSDVNDDLPSKKHATKEYRFLSRYNKQEATNTSINKVDFQQSSLGNVSDESSKEKILKHENKFRFDSSTHSQRPGNNSNGKRVTSQAPYRLTSMVDLSNNSNNEKQRNLELPNNESSTENLDERNELRKRKRTVIATPLSPHFKSNKIQVKSDTSPVAKKTKVHPSNLRAPTSISRLKYNADQRKVGFASVPLKSSNVDGFKAPTKTNLQVRQVRLSHQVSDTKQRK